MNRIFNFQIFLTEDSCVINILVVGGLVFMYMVKGRDDY